MRTQGANGVVQRSESSYCSRPIQNSIGQNATTRTLTNNLEVIAMVSPENIVTPASAPDVHNGSHSVTIRTIRPDDIEVCGRIAYEAHSTVAAAHNVPCEHPSEQFSIGLIGNKEKDKDARGFVAEHRGRIVGSIFVNVFPSTPVAAIGPLTVSPSAEGGHIGQKLMEAALDEAASRGLERVRLVQSPSHLRSLALYTKLGFVVREPLVLIQGALPAVAVIAGCSVRRASLTDMPSCERICAAFHGFTRSLSCVRQSNS
jgi:predicted N-acetyltransferase YhbS